MPPSCHPQYSVHSSLDPLSGAPPLSPGTLRRLQQQSTVSAKQTPPRVWALPQLPTSLSEEDVTQQLALDRQQQRARQSPRWLAEQGTSLAGLSSSLASLPGGIWASVGRQKRCTQLCSTHSSMQHVQVLTPVPQPVPTPASLQGVTTQTCLCPQQ